MRKIIIEERTEELLLSKINQHSPVFAKRYGEFQGMVVKEDKGWILRIGGGAGSNGHHETLRELLESNVKHGYEFYSK